MLPVISTIDPFAGETLAAGFALGAMTGAYVGNRMAWLSARWAHVAWHEVQRHRRLRKLRGKRRNWRSVWS